MKTTIAAAILTAIPALAVAADLGVAGGAGASVSGSVGGAGASVGTSTSAGASVSGQSSTGAQSGGTATAEGASETMGTAAGTAGSAVAAAEGSAEATQAAAVAALVDTQASVMTADDIVIGAAQSIRQDAEGRWIATIALDGTLETEANMIAVPVSVTTTASGENALTVAMTQAQLQSAIDAQTGANKG